ncbi:MAG: ABC transporter ATP-binding protein [Xanthomonadaceae bacterium]|jgi:lipopolysaccharide transport system ATP-binding protein|nr:ABC transporter ATP-binding protein [Xanthomonadaceae bacterium]
MSYEKPQASAGIEHDGMNGDTGNVIEVRDISKCYHVYEQPSDRLKQAVYPRIQRLLGRPSRQYFREFWALKDLSFDVKAGESVGIIGRNGSGKSTLLQLICGTLEPTGGTVQTRGRIAALLELGSGFNPEFSGRENVYMNGAILGLSEEEMAERYDSIVAFSEIEAFIDQPVKTYSSGMFMRLAFAVQAHIDASIVIIDEALTVGDVFFRQKCYARLEKLRDAGAAILLVSHSMPDIEQYCERAILLNQGEMRFIGSSSEAARHYYLINQGIHPTLVQDTSDSDSGTGFPAKLADHAPCLLPQEALLDITHCSQVSNGQAYCRAMALLDGGGQPCDTFRQGDKAIFYSEYVVTSDMGIPICGTVISNERGIIIHGKNSWQHEMEPAGHARAGTIIRCWQEITLDIGPGDYVFEAGLSTVSETEWNHRYQMSYEQIAASETRVCHVVNAGTFSVGLAMRNHVATLTHHGIADLPGRMRIDIVQENSTSTS